MVPIQECFSLDFFQEQDYVDTGNFSFGRIFLFIMVISTLELQTPVKVVFC
jgi:hypothetical protein